MAVCFSKHRCQDSIRQRQQDTSNRTLNFVSVVHVVMRPINTQLTRLIRFADKTHPVHQSGVYELKINVGQHYLSLIHI